MARISNRLTTRTIPTLGDGRHADGGGLYLVVNGTRRRWVYIWTANGQRRELGLGSVADVSLASAREKAAAARKAVLAGSDPIAERRAAATAMAVVTFGSFADEHVETITPGFRNAKHAAQWASSLGKVPYDPDKIRMDRKAHAAHVAALAALRAKPIGDVETAEVLAVITPIWQAAPETASRVRGRIEKVLDAAKAKGFRTGENPARWRGHVDLLLPNRTKVSRGHHAAMPFDEVPALIARLRAVGGVSAAALEFTVLTAARSGETLGATWDEIDLGAKVWTIPAGRMKGGRVHRVPLADRALAILVAMASIREDDRPGAFLFPGAKRGRPLSSMALAMALRRLEVGDATPHGFRSSFRDWCGEATSFPREVAEAALAHAIGDSTEAAYRRGDALEKRRKLMDAWGRFCEPRAGSNVVALKNNSRRD